MTEYVYLTVYTNRYPDDGFEIGGAYRNEELAVKMAEERRDNEYGWENYDIQPVKLQ
jgi:hypothetical protein